MRLLYCLPFFPYLYTPWLFREMAWMRQRGHHVAVISLGAPPGPAADLRSFGLDGLAVLQVRLPYRSDLALAGTLLRHGPPHLGVPTGTTFKALRQTAGLRQGLHDWITRKRIVRFVQRFSADMIEAHWAAHSAMVARQIKLATGVPYAVRIHGGGLYRNPSPHLQEMVEDADAVCPVSQFLAQLLLGERPDQSLPPVPPVRFDLNKLRICPNGVPLEQIASEPVEQRDDRAVVGTIGRVDSEKRQADLVEAVGMLASEHRGLQLKIIGGGAKEPQLRERAAALGIADRVQITGPLTSEQVMREREDIHIYAHVSAVEGCSLGVAEGLARGVPAVLTRVGAAAESIDEGVNGYTVKVADVAAIAARLDVLLRASAARRHEMGAASIRIIRERFESQKLLERLESILTAASRRLALPA
jgi:glycosyltransferase involved in cell wall biosynthesis